MKSTTIAFAAALVAMAVHAQAADREAQFKRLEAAYARAPSVQQVPPLFTEWLRTARAVNSHVPPEAWKEIEAECVETLARSRTLALGIWLRHTFAKLSDADLEHLVTLREDPVMEKADAMAAAPDAQSEMIKMAGAQVVELPANAIRQVMLKHGLKVAPNSR